MDVQARKWTRAEYSPHAAAIRLVERTLTEVFGPVWDVRSQMPVALDDESEPEPDVAVVPLTLLRAGR